MIDCSESFPLKEKNIFLDQLWNQKNTKDALPIELKLISNINLDLKVGLRDTGEALTVGLFSEKNNTILPEGWIVLFKGSNYLECNTANDIKYGFGFPDKKFYEDHFFCTLLNASDQNNQGMVVGFTNNELKGKGIGKWLINLSQDLAHLEGKKQIIFRNCNESSQKTIEKSGLNISDNVEGRNSSERTIVIKSN
jgi:hypothetical protein